MRVLRLSDAENVEQNAPGTFVLKSGHNTVGIQMVAPREQYSRKAVSHLLRDRAADRDQRILSWCDCWVAVKLLKLKLQ